MRHQMTVSAGLRAGGFMLAALLCQATELSATPNDLYAGQTDPVIQTWEFTPCVDKQVGRLVGLQKDTALARVAKMNLHSFRLLYPEQVVNFEADRSRLTMVVDKHLRITRAFCR